MKKILFVLITVFVVYNTSAQNIISAQDLIISGNYTEAAGMLNNIILNDSSNAELYRKLAYCYSASEQYNKAIEVLLRGIELKPDDSRFTLMLGDNYMSLEMYKEAKEMYLEYQEQNLNNIDGQLKLAKVYIALKEWTAGEAILNKLVGDGCNIPVCYELLAKCQESLEDNNNAVVSYYNCVRLNPNSIKNVINLCNLLFRMEKPKSAQSAAESNMQYHPQSSELWRIKAEALFKQEVYDMAVNSYKLALMYGDTSITLYRNMGICLYAVGRPDSAFKYLNIAFNKKCDDYITSLYLGKVLQEFNNTEEADYYLKKVEAIQTDSYVVESFVTLAVVYQKKKDYKKSIEYFSRALEFAPDRKSILFRIAAAYDEAFIDKSDALKYYARYTGDSVNTDPKLYEYAVKRINEINSGKHN